jgi:ligand-binding SRPBCC domain-containing protein
MTRIETSVELNVPIATAFDAERNISLHTLTQKHRDERAVAGVTSGLIELGQEVEWEAIHLGLRRRLRVRITHMRKPIYFRDEMVLGAFQSFAHEHYFSEAGFNKTIKKDILIFSAPFGIFGRIVEKFFLADYMRRFLEKKNIELKRLLE